MKNALIKIPTLKTGDDAEVIAHFTELFHEAQNGLRAIVQFGLYAEHVKHTKLKHGQFGLWVKGTFSDVSYRSVRGHMLLADTALEAAGFKSLKGFFKKCEALQIGSALPFSAGRELLLLPDKSLPAEAIEIRAKIFSVIDGKSARQLFAEFKQAEEDEDGNLKKKHGRLKGKGGASAAQRAAAQAKEEAATIEGMEADALNFGLWMQDVSDLQRLPKISDAAWADLAEKVAAFHAFIKQVNQSRKTS